MVAAAIMTRNERRVRVSGVWKLVMACSDQNPKCGGGETGTRCIRVRRGFDSRCRAFSLNSGVLKAVHGVDAALAAFICI
jgi:hypothetical protein